MRRIRHRPLEIIRDWRKGPIPSPAQTRKHAREERAVVAILLRGAPVTAADLQREAKVRDVPAVLGRLQLRGISVSYSIGAGGTGYVLWQFDSVRQAADEFASRN